MSKGRFDFVHKTARQRLTAFIPTGLSGRYAIPGARTRLTIDVDTPEA